MIKLDNLSFGYEKDNYVLKDLSFAIEQGENVGLIGANGCGKSTLLKILVGLLSYEGKATAFSLPIEKKNYAEIRRKIGYVLQDSDNQLFMSKVSDDVGFAPKNYGYSKEKIETVVNESLEKVGILHLMNRQNSKLSGGEKKLASIAVVLAMNPEMMLLDEPSNGLDPYNRRKVINILKELPQTKLIASHDLDLIYDTCSRVLVLSDGKIMAEGKTEDILKDKELLEKYHLELPLRFQ